MDKPEFSRKSEKSSISTFGYLYRTMDRKLWQGLWKLLHLCSFCSQVSGGGPGDAFGHLENKNKWPLSTTVSDCNRLLREMTVALTCFLNLSQVPLLANFNLESSRK